MINLPQISLQDQLVLQFQSQSESFHVKSTFISDNVSYLSLSPLIDMHTCTYETLLSTYSSADQIQPSNNVLGKVKLSNL